LTDDAIDGDLTELCLWIAEITDGMQPEVMAAALDLALATRAGGDAFRLPL
jgi:hypothetical protein